MHGNFAQIPFALAAGLILGYIAMEYSIWHSLLLHISNNLILGDVSAADCRHSCRETPEICCMMSSQMYWSFCGIVLLLRKYRSIPRICSSKIAQYRDNCCFYILLPFLEFYLHCPVSGTDLPGSVRCSVSF